MSEITMESTKPTRKKPPPKEGYITNQDFYDQAKVWILKNREAGKIVPMPNELAKFIMKLVENYGRRKCYSGYTYLEDMKSEAILTVCKYGHNFNPDKTTNAFAYYTQIIDNAFKAYLNKEKTQQEIKYKQISEDSNLSKHNRNNICLYDENEN